MVDLDKYHFYASVVTAQAFVFKSLVDLLSTNIRNNGNFRLTPDGIYISSNDTRQTILITGDFPRENFSLYKCDEELYYIGINLNVLQSAMKIVKRKERLALYIKKKHREHFMIEICPLKHDPMEHQKIQRYKIPWFQVKKEEMSVEPEFYGHPIVLISSHYQSVCKSLNNISKYTHITVKDSRYINFGVDNNEKLVGADLSFGNKKHQRERGDGEGYEYRKTFETSKLNGIVKLASMSTQIQIYAPNNDDYPLKFKIQAGQLGHVEVYLKDTNTIKKEASTITPQMITSGREKKSLKMSSLQIL